MEGFSHMTRSRKKTAEPQRKPSAKVTLEDVMRSMQDLVHNELAHQPVPDSRPLPVAGLKARKLPKKLPKKSSRPGKKTPEKDPKVIVKALKSLVADVKTGGMDSMDRADPKVPEEVEEILLETSKTVSGATPGTDQDGQLYLNLDSESGQGSALSLTADDLVKVKIQKKMEQTLDNTAPDDFDAQGVPGGQTANVDADGIPVLNQIVAPAPMPPGSAPAFIDMEPLDGENLKDVAVRVIARLNIERRKSGQDSLDAKTIHRLQNLLSLELEQKASNVDNTAQD